MELHLPREPSSPQKEHHSSISFDNQTRSSAARRSNSLVSHMLAPRNRRQARPRVKPDTWMPAAEHTNSKDFNVPSPRSTLHHQIYNYQSRYMPKFPIFTGKAEEWDAFWMQFTACAETLNLHSRDYATQLLLSLRGKAMDFAAELDMETVRDPTQLVAALKTRYSCRVPAHIHREQLANMHKNPSETFQDYAAKIQSKMIKAYPDIQKSETFNQLAIHHFLQGLQDQNLSYEVMKLKPRTLTEATDHIIWLNSCQKMYQKSSCIRTIKNNKNDAVSHYQQSENQLIKLLQFFKNRKSKKIKEEITNMLNHWKAKEKQQKPALRTLARSHCSEKNSYTRQHKHSQNEKHQPDVPASHFIPDYTNADLRRLQREDPDLKIVHQWMDDQQLPPKAAIYPSRALKKYRNDANRLIRKNGILYRRAEHKGNQLSLQLLVPKDIQEEVIRNHHDTPDHPGRNKTSRLMKQHFYWYKLDLDVKMYLQCCKKCTQQQQCCQRLEPMSIHKDAVPDVDCNNARGTFTKAISKQMIHRTTSSDDCTFYGPHDVADETQPTMYQTQSQMTSDTNCEGLRTFDARPAEP